MSDKGCKEITTCVECEGVTYTHALHTKTPVLVHIAGGFGA